LQRERKSRDWSQTRLAENLKRQGTPITQSVISKLESGGRMPHPYELVAVAKLFGLTVDTMLGHSGGKDDSLDYTLRTLRDTARRSVSAIQLVANDIEAADREVFRYAFANGSALFRFLDEFQRHVKIAVVALRIVEMVSEMDFAAPPGFAVGELNYTPEQRQADADAYSKKLRDFKRHLSEMSAAVPHAADVYTAVFQSLTDQLFPTDDESSAEQAVIAAMLGDVLLPLVGA
jgi:transcriptional regulator with XRE-family HTH domain